MLKQILFSTLVLASMLSVPAYAQDGGTHIITPHEWFLISLGLIGGMTLLMYGIDKMSSALKIVASDKMKQLMWRLTRNRIMSLFTGAFITAVVQSSTVTTVLLVGFVSARLMSLAQSIGVILGADIGTTVTAQIFAFNINQYALLPVIIGFSIVGLMKSETAKHIGSAIMGLGLVFFGIDLMSHAVTPLKDQPFFLDSMAQLGHPLLGIAAGAIITALLRSSAATIAMVIPLAAQGLITIDAGIAIVLGANIGTCNTAILAALGKSREAIRVAVAHVLFKVCGVLLVLPFIPEFTALVIDMSPGEAGATSSALVPRQVANAHTLFNISVALIFLPFTTQFARFINYIVPDKPLDETEIKPQFLDNYLLSTPSLALTAVRSEMRRMGQEVNGMMELILPAVISGSRADLRRVEKKDEDVDSLHAHIIAYLGEISKKQLTDKQTTEMLGLMYATHHLENIGDLIETNLVNLGHQRIDSQVEMSVRTQEVITSVHQVVQRSITESLKAITELDSHAAERVLEMKGDFNKLIQNSVSHQTKRLVADERNRINAFSVEMDIIDRLQRVYFHSRRIATSTLSITEQKEPRA